MATSCSATSTRIAFALALVSFGTPFFSPVVAQDQLSRVAVPGVTLRAFGYDPTTDAMFLATNSSEQIIKLSGVGTGSPTPQAMVYITTMQRFYINNDTSLIGDATGTLNGMLLNPLPVGDAPAYSFAVCIDSGARIYKTVNGTRTYYPAITKRLYTYDLGPADPSGDASDALTSRVTLADMQDAAGSTSTSTSVGRQMAWSGDGQSVYFTDSSPGDLGGLWKVGALAGSPRLLVPISMENSEPGVFSAGGVDRIYFSGISGSNGIGNAGGIDFVAHDGTTTSGLQVGLGVGTLNAFLELSSNLSSQRISSVAFAGNDMYFGLFGTNTDGLRRYQGIYRMDAQGRLSKVANRTERELGVSASVGQIFDRFQPREITYTGTAGSFSATQILYRESNANMVAGAIVFKPGDFNRDNEVTSADIDLFKPQVTASGTANVKTNVADLKFDMNGNDVVSWKDVQILEQFLDYVPDPTLAGRVIPELPIKADTNLDGVVDFTDFRIMRDNYLPAVGNRTFLVGDSSGDDRVDFADLQPWVNSEGYRSAVVGAGVPATPFNRVEFDAFLATLTPPNVTLDVASGTSTQFEKGYRSIVIAANVTKTGSGAVVFDGTNTYSGTTTVAAGSLIVDPAGTFGASPLVAVRAGATLDVSRVAGGLTVANGQALGGSGTVVGSVVFGRGATLSPGAGSGIGSLAAAVAPPSAEPFTAAILTVPEPALGPLATLAALAGIAVGASSRRRQPRA